MFGNLLADRRAFILRVRNDAIRELLDRSITPNGRLEIKQTDTDLIARKPYTEIDLYEEEVNPILFKAHITCFAPAGMLGTVKSNRVLVYGQIMLVAIETLYRGEKTVRHDIHLVLYDRECSVSYYLGIAGMDFSQVF